MPWVFLLAALAVLGDERFEFRGTDPVCGATASLDERLRPFAKMNPPTQRGVVNPEPFGGGTERKGGSTGDKAWRVSGAFHPLLG